MIRPGLPVRAGPRARTVRILILSILLGLAAILGLVVLILVIALV